MAYYYSGMPTRQRFFMHQADGRKTVSPSIPTQKAASLTPAEDGSSPNAMERNCVMAQPTLQCASALRPCEWIFLFCVHTILSALSRGAGSGSPKRTGYLQRCIPVLGIRPSARSRRRYPAPSRERSYVRDQSLSQNGVLAPSIRQPVQLIISGGVVTKIVTMELARLLG